MKRYLLLLGLLLSGVSSSAAPVFWVAGEDEIETPTFGSQEGGIEILRGDARGSVRIIKELSYAIVPSFIGDDLIYDPREAGGLDELHIPAENILLGLIEGGDGLLFLCWPRGSQRTILKVKSPQEGKSCIEEILIHTDDKPIYVGHLATEKIWHRVLVNRESIERNVEVDWTPPFPARWIAQFNFQVHTSYPWWRGQTLLNHEGISNTFTVWNGERRRWKAMVGWFEWPCWFEDETTFLRIGKKVCPPGQDALFYYLEGNDETPKDVLSLVDFVRLSLGQPKADLLLDMGGRRRMSLHREGCIYRRPTCETTDRLGEIFARGAENEERELVRRVTGDLLHYLEQMETRLDIYEALAKEMEHFIREREGRDKDAEQFLEKIGTQMAIEGIFSKRNDAEMRDILPSGAAILQEVRSLSTKKEQGNERAYRGLKGEITRRGGALDNCSAHFDFIVRGLAQRAGYRCVGSAEDAQTAKELRGLIRKHLRHPTDWEQFR